MAARVDGVDRCDVAVVGGSLAGAAAATALARTGARVVVLEKARFPRNKVCGCFLSAEALPVVERMGFGEELGKEDFESITRFTLVQSSGKRVDAELPAPVLSISRERLDALAAAAAQRAGVEFRFGVAVLAIEGNLPKGFLARGVGWELHARAVVGAWGRYSPLDGRLGRSFIQRKSSLFGFGKTLSGNGDRFAHRAVLHFFDGGYVGLSRVEGGLVNLAALASRPVVHEAHDDLEGLLARLSKESAALARDLEGLTAVPGPPLVSEPMYLGPHGALAGDVLCVGDAAGVIDPFTGTGMSLALRSGDAVAAPLVRFLAGSLGAAGLRREHLKGHREIAGRRFLTSRLFRPFFSGGVVSRLVHPAAAPLARWAARITR